jgi:hypothetical protein
MPSDIEGHRLYGRCPAPAAKSRNRTRRGVTRLDKAFISAAGKRFFDRDPRSERGLTRSARTEEVLRPSRTVATSPRCGSAPDTRDRQTFSDPGPS